MKSETVLHLTRIALNATVPLIAIASLIAAIGGLVAPEVLEGSALGRDAGDWAYLWNGLYMIGAFGITVNLLKPRFILEYVGHVSLGMAFFSNAAAIFIVSGAAGFRSGMIYLAVATGLVLRAGAIYFITAATGRSS